MTQQEILDLLKKSKKSLSINEISKKLSLGRHSVHMGCLKLCRDGDLDKEILGKSYFYFIKKL